MKTILRLAASLPLLFASASSFTAPAAHVVAARAGGEKTDAARPKLRTRALKINVDDMGKALAFYVGKLGFEVEAGDARSREVLLKADDRVKLILAKVGRLRMAAPEDSKLGMTLQVNDLDEAIERMKSAGVALDGERRKEGVGNAIHIRDPFGRRISLMHQTVVKVAPFKEPRLYNFGFLVPDMTAARAFYADKLGFVVRSERYLPLDLPLGNPDNTFGFMLHQRPNVRAVSSDYPKSHPFYTIVFEADDLRAAADALAQAGVKIVSKKLTKESGGRVVFEDPFGNVSELVSAM